MKKIKIKINRKKKINFNPTIVNVHIQCSLKNTIISLTKSNGNLLKQWSTKSLKKTELKKNTPYNVQLITNRLIKYMSILKIKYLKILMKGNGVGRYNVIKNIKRKKFKVLYIIEQTVLPFNGCRQKKQKRR